MGCAGRHHRSAVAAPAHQAILAALGKEHELAMHIRATRNTGVTPDEVKELMLQVAVYAGVPAANSAVAIAKKVYMELAEQSGNQSSVNSHQ